ncbi:MAG TPA: glycosyltransferase family 2 protein [Leucothrix mucor]|uniref:Glycosyltransferase family 2 protein n=1 Tax=Leucothrix mucor TaxID=45248 RepID=A0A7V2T375_LEUMU|nr:glycosyltransferase family 2 protein [Leucothrix mucor]
MNNISGLIITYNEENNIEGCIESLKKVCDEIVIVDSNSVDGTRERAEAMGVIFIQQDFLGDGPQRSHGLSYCSHPWVLNLDADERLDEDVISAIQSLDLESTTFDAFEFKRKNHLHGKWIKHADWYPDYVRRLFNKEATDFSPVAVHTKIKTTNTKKLDCNIIHYSFKDLEDMVARLNTYSTWGALQLYKQGKKVNSLSPFLHGLFSFIKFYIFKRGFLAGVDGMSISMAKSVSSYLKYAKLIEYKSNDNKS